MKIKHYYAYFFINCLLAFNLYAQTPDGLWTIFDDKTGQKRVIVNMNVSHGKLTGTIEKVYKQPGDTGLCTKCPGVFKDKSITGLQFVWGLQDEGQGVWGGGHILDPKTGKIYRAKITLDGNKLHVRGYIGFSLLGRTQVWKKFKGD